MKLQEKKAKWELHKNTVCHFEQILEATPNKNSSCTATYLPSNKSFTAQLVGTGEYTDCISAE